MHGVNGVDANPSSLRRRAFAAFVALAGLAMATYLGCYQLGWWDRVWDPFFPSGSIAVLHSSVSRLLPIPDALVGAAAYLAEVLLELAGGETRWQTHPRLTAVNMALVLGMGLGSVGLVGAQALVFRAWCTLCLASAACSFVIVALSWPEIGAVAGRFRRARA